MTSPAPASQPTPTEAEQELAADVHFAWLNDPHDSPLSCFIAQALADQRAEYEAVAVWLDGEAADRERRMEQLPTSSSYSLDRSLLAAGARRQREAALRIRQVGQ